MPPNSTASVSALISPFFFLFFFPFFFVFFAECCGVFVLRGMQVHRIPGEAAGFGDQVPGDLQHLHARQVDAQVKNNTLPNGCVYPILSCFPVGRVEPLVPL